MPFPPPLYSSGSAKNPRCVCIFRRVASRRRKRKKKCLKRKGSRSSNATNWRRPTGRHNLWMERSNDHASSLSKSNPCSSVRIFSYIRIWCTNMIGIARKARQMVMRKTDRPHFFVHCLCTPYSVLKKPDPLAFVRGAFILSSGSHSLLSNMGLP